jgi:hypothetical protein
MLSCLNTQGSHTKLRKGPSIASLKVQTSAGGRTWLVLTAFVSDKEQSLEETKQIVRKKLGLGSDTPIELAQLRGGKRIDLEDGTSPPAVSFTEISILFR